VGPENGDFRKKNGDEISHKPKEGFTGGARTGDKSELENS
jgi:hypothetical protein